MNGTEFFAFIIAAIALLGSPGPAIAALLAVGRSYGWGKGLGFYWGLQFGLAAAAGITVLGLFAMIQAFPFALVAMSVIATAYLLYLAFKIATSPVGNAEALTDQSPKPAAGALIGLTNPKAYMAFASLFASFQVFSQESDWENSVKWAGVVAVMIVVDAIWLWIGVKIGQLNLSPKTEQIINYSLAGAIVVAAILALL